MFMYMIYFYYRNYKSVGEKMKLNSKNISFIKYFSALLLFGTNGIVASLIDLESNQIVLYRTFLGSLILFAIILITRNKFSFFRHKKDFFFLCLSGISMGASWLFLYEGYNQIGVGTSSLLYYSGPVIVMILSPFLFKEKFTIFKIVGFFSVVSGIFLVNGPFTTDNFNLFGMICGLMSAITYAFMVIFNKKAEKICGLENSLLQLFISFLTVLIFAVAKQDFTINIPMQSIFPLLFLGIVNTGLGCYLYFSSIGNLPVQTVAICGYIEPLSAVIFSVIFLQETMFPLQIIGTVLIIGGAVFAECFKYPSKK